MSGLIKELFKRLLEIFFFKLPFEKKNDNALNLFLPKKDMILGGTF